jgi:chorismate lyase/3-hydroxybenzoate synthase
MMPPTTAAAARLHISYDAEVTSLQLKDDLHLQLPHPLLDGIATQELVLPDGHCSWQDDLLVMQNDDHIIGAGIIDCSGRLEGPTQNLYEQLLHLCLEKKMTLHRVWQFVPRINEHLEGLERYRQFNIGRWLAFESCFGRDLRSFMPAASAVGVGGDSLALYFTAGRAQPLYFENPAQVPAYHYPAEYGPRPPSFARGVVVQDGARRVTHLSGTASIEGHRSIGEGDWMAQFRTTLHNMEIMFERMETPHALRGEAPVMRDFTCYLRHPEMLSLMKECVEENTSLRADEIRYLQADICRAELDVEIEGMVIR